ncbi:MAG: hypothetical protein WCR42_10980 [bacterium]
MKIKKSFKINSIIIISLVFICSLIFFISDGKLYYYGHSNFNIFKKSLPLNLEPDYFDGHVSWPPVGFGILDRGFYLITKENSWNFNGDTIKINEIVKYGFNDKQLMALINSTSNKNFYIKCFMQKESVSNNNLQIEISGNIYKINTNKYKKIDIYKYAVPDYTLQVEILDGNYKINARDYQWIDIKKDSIYVKTLDGYRYGSILFLFASILFIISINIILKIKNQSN